MYAQDHIEMHAYSASGIRNAYRFKKTHMHTLKFVYTDITFNAIFIFPTEV